jgi:hypothetical protein
MPEKTTENVKTNGLPKPEIKPEKPVEAARAVAREAEFATRDIIQMYNDLLATTTKYSVDMLGTNIKGTMELANKAQRNMEDVLTIYRRAYTDGFKMWQTYLDEMGKVIPMPRFR